MFGEVNNFIARSHRDIIVVTKTATRGINKVQRTYLDNQILSVVTACCHIWLHMYIVAGTALVIVEVT